MVQNPWSAFDPLGLAGPNNVLSKTQRMAIARRLHRRNQPMASISAADFISAGASGLGEGAVDVAHSFRRIAESPGEAAAHIVENGVVNSVAQVHDQLTTNIAQGVELAANTTLSDIGRDLATAADLYVNDKEFRDGVTDLATGGALSAVTGGSGAFQIARCKVMNKVTKGRTGCFLAGTLVLSASGLVPIEEVQLGDRVATPMSESVSETGIDPESWLRLNLLGLDASTGLVSYEIHLLRPRSWVEDVGAKVGLILHLELEELGLDGPMLVTGVTECPPIEVGSGRVVAALFRSYNENVIALRFEGLEEPVLTTGGHKFFSTQRGAWSPAGGLASGETVHTTGWGTRRLVSAERIPGTFLVYNFNVESEHSYFVSDAGLLVHNMDCPDGGSPDGSATRTVHEAPEATTLSKEEMEYLRLNETDYRAYEHEFESETRYIGEGRESRPEMSAGERSSLHQDPLVRTDEYPVPTKLDAKRYESQLMDDVDAVNNPDYYNIKPSRDPLDR